ncbi:MAG: response regulator [Desulfovibrio sp.]|nr:response regulator [Desulfovibrio sp.]
MWQSIYRMWRHGIPLRFCIAALVVVTVIILTALIQFGTHRSVAKISQDLAEQHFALLIHDIRGDIELRINPILHMLQGTSHFVRDSSLRSYKMARQTYRLSCIQALSAHRNILALNFGFHDGSFFSVVKLNSPEVRQRFGAPDNAMFVIWAIAPDESGELVEWWEFLAADKGSISLQNRPLSYDPRKRSWYMAAMITGRLTLTPPYEFTVSREMGITCAAPMGHGLGVVSVNIMLQDFRNLLHTLEPSANGKVFLLDAQYKAIAGVMHTNNTVRLLDTKNVLPLGMHGIFSPNVLSELLYSTCDDIRTIEIDGETYFFRCDDIEIGDKVMILLMLAPVSDFTGFSRNFLGSTILFAMLSLLLIIPVGVFFAMRLSAPLQHLQQRAMEVKRGALGSKQAIVSRIYEVQRLSRSLRSMQGSILRRTKALLDIQKKQEQIVAERTAELVQARDQAEQATLAKSTFLSTVSHEMRTPLNAVIGFTHLFDLTGLSEKQKKSLEKIRISSEQLLCVINDVLDFSKIEAGKLDIEIISFQPRALVDSVLSVVSFGAQAKHLSLTAYVADDVPENLMGDPARLRQILLNLLNNAVKFTAVGGITLDLRINTALADHPENVVPLYFSVSDTGMGIAPQQLRTIFQPFVQADNSISRRYGGTGLGLSICRHLVELMGGSIQVTSKTGQGTCFFFTLPMTHVAGESVKGNNREDSLLPLPVSSLSSRVLVVDDNAINREIACAMLEALGIENTDTAEDGGEAVRKVLSISYDLVFMDMQMPVMDGLAASRAIRAAAEEDRQNVGRKPVRTWLENLPIIAMTANALAEDKKRCIEAGMDDHIAKPLLPDVLHALLLRWLPDKRV